MVSFVETTYAVDESVGSVNVCVALTQPETDILDETVNVFVVDNSSSVYIPAGAPLASRCECNSNTDWCIGVFFSFSQHLIHQISSVNI